MPKKAPKNAFYYFMLDFKQKQQKQGINYGSLADVAKAADPEWRNAPPSVRTKFDEIAKQEKLRGKDGAAMKYTSTGIPLSHIEQQQREQQESVQFEKDDIKNMIKLKSFNMNSIMNEDFFVMDVNSLCKANDEYVIGESTVLRFNLKNGFRDSYHEIINPGRIPLGYASDVKQSCKELGFEMPDESAPRSNYMHILSHIIDYLKRSDKEVKTLPPLYTMPEKVTEVQDFIVQMCNRAGEDEFLFRVYRLDTLFYTLMNTIKSSKDEGFPKESLALLQLRKDMFRYTPGLGCEHHESGDKSIECTASRTKRWAFTILDSCCPVLGIDVKPGLHVPRDYDVEGILSLQDQKKERPAPTVAGFGVASSSCNTTLNDSLDVSFAYANTSTASEKPRREDCTGRANLRKPQTNRSEHVRQAPELSESNFPALVSGRGRGRGLAANFENMNIKK